MKRLFLLHICALSTLYLLAIAPPRVCPGDQPDAAVLAAYEAQRAELEQQAMAPERAAAALPGIGVRSIFPRVPVIMVNFQNQTFITTREQTDSLFNAVNKMQVTIGSTTIPYGSVAQYFDDQSLGAYRPQFDVVGPYTLSSNYSNYGSSNSATQNMIAEACQLADGDVDFSQYDSDNDGYVDLVFVYFAGYGENDKNYLSGKIADINGLVWPHFSSTSTSATFDGKRIYGYECSNELDGYYSYNSGAGTNYPVVAGIGVLVHEFSHGMGLPDVYSGTTQYMGLWSLMDYGCYAGATYCPAGYTGYERWFMGWSSPKALNRCQNVTLNPLGSSGEFGVVTSNGSMPSKANEGTYWVVENRQKKDWDRYLPKAGLIAYKIQYHSSWRAGANSGTQGYVLVPADGMLRDGDGYVGKAGDCYPYQSTTSINVAPNYPITDITRNANGTISLKVLGGYACYDVTAESDCATITPDLTPAGTTCYDATYGYGATIVMNDGYIMDSIRITCNETTLEEDIDYLFEDGYLAIMEITGPTTVHVYGHTDNPTWLLQQATRKEDEYIKLIEDGQVVILRGGKKYSIIGIAID